MARDRHQNGWVEETGKRVKKWKGHYYLYQPGNDGKEKRVHRATILGLKAEMKKWEAERQLQRIIESQTVNPVRVKPNGNMTLAVFWRTRYLPLKESVWERSTLDAVTSTMDTHVLPRFGESRLCDLTGFDLQLFVNDVAAQSSSSLVDKVMVWPKAILNEAVEQEFLSKNPARRLKRPITRKICKRFLLEDEIQRLSAILEGRDRLIVRLLILCALRPGELFALRWRNVQDNQLQIEEAVYRGRLGSPKTAVSSGKVYVPDSLSLELDHWRLQCGDPNSERFVFESKNGTPLDAHNFLQRILQPHARRAGIKDVTFQALRRTFATQVHPFVTVKDAQCQLRHASASTTLNVYTQPIPGSLKEGVEALDRKLFPVVNTIEHKFAM